jgi:c(7)-type cytochrome triheme protein
MLVATFVAGCLLVKGAWAGEAKKEKTGKGKAVASEKKEAAVEKKEAAVEKKEASAENKEAAGEKDEAAGEAKGPDAVVFEKVGKLAPVKFSHAAHVKKNKCDDCHGGDAPVYGQKISGGGVTMKEMYAGKSCGACHNGKKAFKAQAGCMKCHKKGTK